MLPRQPRHTFAIRTETRGRIKIVAADQNIAAGLLVAFKIKTDKRVDRLPSGDGVIFAHAEHATPTAVDGAIGIAQVQAWCQWIECPILILTVETLVVEVSK